MVFFSILARRLHQRADIVISGGGMVGASAAAAIAKLGRHSPPPLASGGMVFAPTAAYIFA